MTKADTAAKPVRKKYAVVVLDDPIKRGDQEITEVRLRKPSAGDYRGTTMSAAYAMDPVALAKVISRVSDPMISEPEFMAMDADDAAELGGEIVDFLLSTRRKDAAGLNG